MRVWGIGANWGGKPKAEEFISNGYAGIGWLENEAPSLYKMMMDIEKGDIIYIKSFTTRNCVLNIKAVGRVMSTAFSDPSYYKNKDKHITIQVLWNNDFPKKGLVYNFNANQDIKGKIDLRNNVYSNTLYREYSDNIIKVIASYIPGK